MPRITVSLESAQDAHGTCDWCDPENDRPIRNLEMADDDGDSMRLCFLNAVQLRDSLDPRERRWARLTPNLDYSK